MHTLAKIFLSALFLICVPYGFAIDGQVVINQSTVMAAGGFPYRITQPGSYKLSGNLVAPLDVAAIRFDASNVTLDFNGFNISCSFDDKAPFLSGCITDASIAHVSLTLKNGSLSVSANANTFSLSNNVAGVNLQSSTASTVDGLHINGVGTNFSINGLVGGKYFIIRNNVFSGLAGPSVSCPSVVTNNVNASLGAGSSGTGCVGSNNVFVPF